MAPVLRVGVFVAVLSGCVGVEVTVPPADPDKHPRPKTEPAEDIGVAYFRHRARWHQLRVGLGAEEPEESGSAYLVKFTADASLWRFNSRTGEYDIPAKFVGVAPYYTFSITRDEDDPGRLEIFRSAGSEGGGATVGWRGRPFTQVRAVFKSADDFQPRREQRVSGVVTASYFPNGSSHPFRFEAQLEREWVIRASSGTQIEVVPATDAR